MAIPIDINHERLVLALDEAYPRLSIRNTRSPDFNLSEKELYFKLGQRSVIDFLLDELEKTKQQKHKEDI